MKSGFFGRTAACAAVIGMAASPVLAGDADSLGDLYGASTATAKAELIRRGFHFSRGNADNSTSPTTTWWHPADQDCVAIDVSQDQIIDINDVRAADCGERVASIGTSSGSGNIGNGNSGNGGGGGGGDDAALVLGAVGALAIGALLLSGKDKDKGSGKNRPVAQRDWQEVETFGTQSGSVRIFGSPDTNAVVQGDVREGLHLRNYGCDAYSGENWCEVTTLDGRTSGWARDRYLRPVQPQAAAGGNSGTAYPVQFSDLSGARAPSADAALRDRGFRNVDGFKSGFSAFTVWYRPASRQCIQMEVINDRVESVTDIRAHPSCR